MFLLAHLRSRYSTSLGQPLSNIDRGKPRKLRAFAVETSLLQTDVVPFIVSNGIGRGLWEPHNILAGTDHGVESPGQVQDATSLDLSWNIVPPSNIRVTEIRNYIASFGGVC